MVLFLLQDFMPSLQAWNTANLFMGINKLWISSNWDWFNKKVICWITIAWNVTSYTSKEKAGIFSDIQPFFWRVNVGLTFTDPEHLGSACWTHTLCCRPFVLHGYGLGILHFFLGSTFHTVCLHSNNLLLLLRVIYYFITNSVNSEAEWNWTFLQNVKSDLFLNSRQCY